MRILSTPSPPSTVPGVEIFAFRDAIENNGGRIHTQTAVKKIIIENKKVTGVIVEHEGREEQIDTDLVICDIPPSEALKAGILDEKEMPREWVEGIRSTEKHDDMAQAIDEAYNDDEVRVIVLTGAGKGFCSGDDVGDVFLSPEEEQFKTRGAKLRQLEGEHPFPGGGHGLLKINKPSIAAVNGAAVGYGCELTLVCNMRVASERARFSEIFLRVGLIPDEAPVILPRLIGLAKTYEMVLTTDFIDAAEAERIGLVNKVVPHDQLMEASMELAEKIATKPPIAVRLAIEGIRRGLNWPMEEYMRYHALASPFCAETEDHKEGALAFLEKRQPVFKGK